MLEPEPEPNFGPEREREPASAFAGAVALIAVHGTDIVYMIVATPAVERIAYALLS